MSVHGVSTNTKHKCACLNECAWVSASTKHVCACLNECEWGICMYQAHVCVYMSVNGAAESTRVLACACASLPIQPSAPPPP